MSMMLDVCWFQNVYICVNRVQLYFVHKSQKTPEHSASDTGLTRIPGSSCEARESLEVQEEEPEVHSAVEIGGHQDIQRHFAVKENTLYWSQGRQLFVKLNKNINK